MSAGDDDGPPPIPSGWERVELGQPFKHFLLWTRLAKNARAMWHLMTVVQVLAPGRKDKYTHDAHLQSESATKKRGVQLSPAMHESASEDGIWVGISKVGEEVSPPPAVASKSARKRKAGAPAAAHAPAPAAASPARVQPERKRAAVAPFTPNRN